MIKYLTSLLICMVPSFCVAAYSSQCGQDRFINENFFKGHRNGFFLDIGAHDGISLNDTYFFEKELGWSGICIEPLPEVYESLEKNRNCDCIFGCVSVEEGVSKEFLRLSGPHEVEMLSGIIDNYDTRHLRRIGRELEELDGTFEIIESPCYNLNRILEEKGVTRVNFLSLDIEGGEYEILQDLDFSKFQVDVIVLEDNYHDPRFVSFLESKGFSLVETLWHDVVFLNNNFELN